MDDAFWLCVGGQPVARLDLRYVADALSFAAVTPLVSGFRLQRGDRTSLWPAPYEARRGSATSAVCYVENAGGRTIVWVAAPTGVACRPDAHLDFCRQARFVGHGIVERRDDRFWYASFTPLETGPADTQPTSAPHRDERAGVCVGDTVHIRTRADVRSGRFTARVFALTEEGALVNAGEAEGLRRGQVLPVYRAGRPCGAVRPVRVQRGYTVARAAEGDGGGVPLVPGDEIAVGPRAAAARTVGRIREVVEGGLFVADLSADDVPAGIPLAIRGTGGVTGVAILFAVEGRRAGGFVVPASLTAEVAAGQALQVPADAGGAERMPTAD
jgi:hypothetical protein